jgi:molybdenum cofactor cytidylyltransferase
METVLLAAGASSRMGGIPKQLLPFGHVPLVVHSVETALHVSDKVILVTGFQAELIEDAVSHAHIDHEDCLIIVRNKHYEHGQFSSTHIGVSHVSPEVDFFITMADLPLIEPYHYIALAEQLGTHDAVRPHHNGYPGHPVIVSNRMRDTILKLPITATMRDFISTIDVGNWEHPDSAWITGIDTPEDYRRLLTLKHPFV